MDNDKIIAITRNNFKDAVTKVSTDYVNDEDLSLYLKSILPALTLIIGSKIEKNLFGES